MQLHSLLLGAARSAMQRPRRAVAATVAAGIFCAALLPRLEFRTEGAALYPEGNAVVEQSEQDRLAFDGSRGIILLVSSRPAGPPVASIEGFRFLRQTHRSLEWVGRNRFLIRSLASLLEVVPGETTHWVRPFLARIPDSPEAFTKFASQVREAPLAEGLFLSPDGRAAALYVSPRRQGGEEALMSTVSGWLERQGDSPFDLRMTGPLAAESLLGEMVLRDLAFFIPLMLLAIAALLVICLRSWAGVAIPLAEVGAVLLWTFGAMSLLGIPVTLVTTVLPVVLMSMAIADEVHVLERLQAALAPLSGAPSRDDLRRGFETALSQVGRPVVLTSLTTAAGFLSFLAAPIPPLRHFGGLAALGILLAMALTFVFVPALALLLPTSWYRVLGRRSRKNLRALPRRSSAVGLRAGWAALAAAAILLPAMAAGILRLSIEDSWIDNFDPESDLVTAERDYNRSLWGSYRFDVVFEAEPHFFFSPEGIAWMERFGEVARGGPRVGGVASHLAPYRGVAEYLGLSGELASLSAEDLGRIAGEAEQRKSLTDLRRFLARDGSTARAQLMVDNPDYSYSRALSDYLSRELGRMTAGTKIRFHFSGDVPVAVEVVHSVVVGQLRSIGLVLAGILLLLALAFRRITVAAAVLLPSLVAVLTIFACMGFLGIPLGVATSMFAAMAIGVGVDFGLHFASGYQRSREGGTSHEGALGHVRRTSGRAILWNAVVLSAGLSVLAFSALKPNRFLGLLLAGAILACYWATSLLLPPFLGRVGFRVSPRHGRGS